MIKEIQIGDRRVGEGHPVYTVAELSGNHLHDRGRARDLVHAAAEAGADAVKLQTYTPDTMTIRSDREEFQVRGTSWDGTSLYELYESAYTPWEWQPELLELARSLGMDAFSTPFDHTAVEFLEALGVPVYKVASFEIVDLPLLRAIGRTGKPVIMSTGMSKAEEIREAMDVLGGEGAHDVALLKCTSAYPARPEDMNLAAIPALRAQFGCIVGLSDHTLAATVPVVAVTLGASIIEKHLTLDRAEGGPDSSFSLEPHEFRDMVEAVRTAEKAIGAGDIGPRASERESLVFRKSLFVVESLREGEPFTATNVRCIRPGFGLHSRHLEEVIGKVAARDIERGTPLAWDLVHDV